MFLPAIADLPTRIPNGYFWKVILTKAEIGFVYIFLYLMNEYKSVWFSCLHEFHHDLEHPYSWKGFTENY